MVKEASNSINHMLQMAKTKGLDPQTMAIRYDTIDLIAMPVDTAMLLIICKSGSNTALIATTACILAPEIETMLDQELIAPDENISLDTPETQPAQDNTRETTRTLNNLQEALLTTIGPAAGIIYDDCFEFWTTSNPPDVSRIAELVGYISTELNDPKMFAEFKVAFNNLS